MPKDSYEFTYMSSGEKRKLLVAKCVLALMIASAFYMLIASDATTLSSDLFNVSWILSAFFGYLNLSRVKSELMELFEPPYIYVGYEFVTIGMIVNITAWIV
ncbi:MAG TPA: hypothetical protein EYQ14_20825 [Gammaproteobacteria bacterium]|nr:hypothetical protein [Gammaproteobacteria bacterium]